MRTLSRKSIDDQPGPQCEPARRCRGCGRTFQPPQPHPEYCPVCCKASKAVTGMLENAKLWAEFLDESRR